MEGLFHIYRFLPIKTDRNRQKMENPLFRINKNRNTILIFLCEVQKSKKTFDFSAWTVHNK